ncbi:signal peptidase I [Mucilaginibacter corticis]|uniref:Signal peptidase I n=1 Tax=Mucilaginibacter corticis TaxID=2597670 RepID=A0A556MBN5_9SPHI|nr:signal peptidase I [Mucilaginibacter corticis]TSJ37339.1 signal peptidase I [Mucilaginibacter corticis]
MKKPAVLIVTLFACTVALWITLRATHILNFYSVPTTANEPTYMPGDWLIASKLKKVNNNDFVVFNGPDKGVWIFRCIGKENDIVEIRKAVVYLNGKPLNDSFAWNEYYISKKQLLSIAGYINRNKNTVELINDSLAIGNFTTSELKQYHLNLKPRLAADTVNPAIFADFRARGYNEDNLGPVKVPKDSYFLLGDSRHDAFDSRYFGFVKSDDIISTVIR